MIRTVWLAPTTAWRGRGFLYSVTEELQAAESHSTPEEKCSLQLQGSLSGCPPTTTSATFLIAPTRSHCVIGVAVFGPWCRGSAPTAPWAERSRGLRLLLFARCPSALGLCAVSSFTKRTVCVRRLCRVTPSPTAIPSCSSRCRALQWGVEVLGKGEGFRRRCRCL